jgi:hypothetical protein
MAVNIYLMVRAKFLTEVLARFLAMENIKPLSISARSQLVLTFPPIMTAGQ